MPISERAPGGSSTPSETAVLSEAQGAGRRFLSRHPHVTDGAVVAIYLAPMLSRAFVSASSPGLEFWGWLDVAGVLATGAALVVRRSRPRTVFAVACLATLAMAPGDGGIASGTALAIYALAVYRSTRSAWIGFGIGALVAVAAAAIGILGPSPYLFTQLPGSAPAQLAILLIATLIGVNVGNRNRYTAALVDRAGQLERERDQQAQLAAASERARIAREMHDVVAHGITVMVRLAEGSAASVAVDPARATQAMLQTAETGRRALRDMRRMLGVLHVDESDAVLQPQPGFEGLAELVENARATGLNVTMSAIGEPTADPAEQLTVYRIVQESLTNALRHATGARSVMIEIEHAKQATLVRVADDGHAEGAPRPGHGLLGMQERVGLYGGSLEAGPGDDGGWIVTATVPRADVA